MFLLQVKSKEINIDDFIPTFFPIIISGDNVASLVRETTIAAELSCRNLKKVSQVPNRQQRLKLINQLSQQNSSFSHSSFPTKNWSN